jgi:hypothetical protein
MSDWTAIPPSWCSLAFVRAHCEWTRGVLPAALSDSAWLLLVLYAEFERVEALYAASSQRDE